MISSTDFAKPYNIAFSTISDLNPISQHLITVSLKLNDYEFHNEDE